MTQGFEEDVAPAGTQGDTLPAGTQEDGLPSGTETVPDGMVAEFSSLTTPYCWVITEDLLAGYDGAAPSAVGRYGPPEAGLADLHEALCSGKWFRLGREAGEPVAVGRIYDPAGDNERVPLQEVGQETWGATTIEYRQGGQWEDAP